MGSFLYLVCYTFCTLLSLNSSFLLLTNKLHPSPALLKSLLRPWSLSSVHFYSHVALWWEISLRNRVELQNERLQRWNNRKHLSLSLSVYVYHALREQDPLKQPPLRSKSNPESNLSSILNTHWGERSSPGHQTSSAWISESRSPSHDHRNSPDQFIFI